MHICKMLRAAACRIAVAIAVATMGMPALAATPKDHFTLKQILAYPFPSELTRAASTDELAWVINKRGRRNIWVAAAPTFKAHQVTHYRNDDGQELTGLALSPDGRYAVYARGGDHDNIYTPKAPPNPLANIHGEKVELWSVAIDGGKPVALGKGDAPAMSPDGKRVAFVHHGEIWTAAIDGSGKPHRLFVDNGFDHDLRWSPDGRSIAFVSSRGDHAFIGIYTRGKDRLRFIDPGTTRDSSPRWSPDGRSIAFVRRPGRGGKPKSPLHRAPRPWAIWIADAASGSARALWRSPDTLEGSMPGTAGGANLHWAAGKRLVFLSDVDGWPHLYSVPVAGGKPRRLTAGDYMVEDVAMSADRRFVIYSANTGKRADDIDRRHLFKVAIGGGKPQALTPGKHLQWSPVPLHDGAGLAFIRAGARTPPLVAVKPTTGGATKVIGGHQIPDDFPIDSLIVPRHVTFKASDGQTVYAQLFERSAGTTHKPAVIFVHGGPMRQMLLGWNYSGYYSNAYAVNEYLANQGFVVLSVNYRLGIGHGWQFHHPPDAGPAGASEYRDVLAAGQYLAHLPQVDGTRIGIWGGSYGGYLTALALARNSNLFKAGSDWAGVHDWVLDIVRNQSGAHLPSFKTPDRAKFLKLAWQSSPVASIDQWRSPILLIQGDDDHNVRFHQTVDLARRLEAHDVSFAELVLPNEIHVLLRYHSWYRADKATVQFLQRHLSNNRRHHAQ